MLTAYVSLTYLYCTIYTPLYSTLLYSNMTDPFANNRIDHQVIIMLTAYVARIETPTRPVVSSVLVISLGTAMTCSFTPQVCSFT